MICLFLGETDFPKIVLKKIKKIKVKYFIIDLSKKKIFKKNKNSYYFSIGQFGKIINLIKEKKCNKVIFAGKINKPNLTKVRFDLKGLYYLPKLINASKLGDAEILKLIIRILEKEKIKVISSNFYNMDLTLKKNIYTKVFPSLTDLKNIKLGINELSSINPNNHVQGLIVDNMKIIAKETLKGTKKMIMGIKKKFKTKPILIKFPKKNQDTRIDLPTIGYDTLKDCQKSGIKGIVLKSKKNIFINKKKAINFANKNKIFIIVV